MAAPQYSPVGGNGTSVTDNQGVTWRFDNGQWSAISSGSNQTPQSQASSGGSYPQDKYVGWNPTAAQADYDATGGPSSGGGGGDGGNGTSDQEEFVNLLAQLIGSPTELPPLDVKSFEEYENIAFEELKPYYERILKEEGGDVERAKLRLNQDYERGIRINREDYQAAKEGQGEAIKPGESTQDYYNRTKNQYGTFPEEGIEKLDTTNRRGMMDSGFAQVDAAKMATSQQRRQEAIKNAAGRYAEAAGFQRTRGLEDVNSAWERRQFALDEEQKEGAVDLGRQKRNDEIATQEIERSNIMRKAIQNLYG